MDRQELIGSVQGGELHRNVSGPFNARVRLTRIQPQAAGPPEAEEVPLEKYEGKMLLVRGIDQGEWIYSAEIIDVQMGAGSAFVGFVRSLLSSKSVRGQVAGAVRFPAADARQEPGDQRKFTEGVLVSVALDRRLPEGMRVHRISYEPGNHTHWHWHDGEQALYGLEGKGWLKAEGEATLQLDPNDIVYISPGIRHWHGASPTDRFTHLAFTASGGTEWGDQLTPAEYAAAARP